jgi:hypothetical protein
MEPGSLGKHVSLSYKVQWGTVSSSNRWYDKLDGMQGLGGLWSVKEIPHLPSKVLSSSDRHTCATQCPMSRSE